MSASDKAKPCPSFEEGKVALDAQSVLNPVATDFNPMIQVTKQHI